jgi:RNA polymerase sigma-70 factor (ECF subfamily)
VTEDKKEGAKKGRLEQASPVRARGGEVRKISRSLVAFLTLEKEEGHRMSNEAAVPRCSLEHFRSWLLLLAGIHLGPEARGRIEPSDVVQQTLLEAYVGLERFKGDESALAAWLRQALVNNLRDAWRALRRDKRDIEREGFLEEAVARSSARLEGMLVARQASPSEQAARGEDVLRLAAALTRLPEAQREAVVLHHLQGCSLAETARRLGRTDAAVAGLLHRGLKKLRELMTPGA